MLSEYITKALFQKKKKVKVGLTIYKRGVGFVFFLQNTHTYPRQRGQRRKRRKEEEEKEKKRRRKRGGRRRRRRRGVRFLVPICRLK